jgi:hypothetical protein
VEVYRKCDYAPAEGMPSSYWVVVEHVGRH